MSNDARQLRSPFAVLQEWRAAERRLAELVPGTPEWHRTRLEVGHLNEEYQVLVGERTTEARQLVFGTEDPTDDDERAPQRADHTRSSAPDGRNAGRRPFG